jgi:hypothetical protein
MSRPLTVSTLQLVQLLKRGYEVQNHGAQAEHLYVPPDMYDMIVDHIDDTLISGGLPAHLLDSAFSYVVLGLQLHSRHGDIVVTREELL